MGDAKKSDSIEKLTGEENYPTWKFYMRLLLIKENTWDAVENAVPAQPDATWKAKNVKAMATIGLAVDKTQVLSIKELETASDYWVTLQSIHEKSSLLNKVTLLKKLCRSQLGMKTMEVHLDEMLSTVDRLKCHGEDLKQPLVVALLLGSLPDDYDSLVTALEVRNENELTVNYVKEI